MSVEVRIRYAVRIVRGPRGEMVKGRPNDIATNHVFASAVAARQRVGLDLAHDLFDDIDVRSD